MEAKNLMSVKELASKLGVHYNTVYNMARDSRIPTVRIGKAIRFESTAVQQWILDNTRAAK